MDKKRKENDTSQELITEEEEKKNTDSDKKEAEETEEEIEKINCISCEKEIVGKRYPSFDLFSNINVNCDDCWKTIKAKQKNHCDICKKKFPSELLRPPYEDIINSKALYKTLITGKGNGKSVNLMMWTIWWIVYHEEGHCVWLWRWENDILDKGKKLWLIAFRAFTKAAEALGLDKYKIRDFNNKVGEPVEGSGIKYKRIQRVYFFSLQNYEVSNSALGGDALYLAFDEAMASDGKYITKGGKNEETRWSQLFDNSMRVGEYPTRCFFLCNPHTKGIFFLERYTQPEWVDEAFSKDWESHYYDGIVDVKIGEQFIGKFQCLLYQAPQKRGKYKNMLNTTVNILRREGGTFPQEAEKWIANPPIRPENFKQLFLIKSCVYIREKKQGQGTKYSFFYKKQPGEILDENICHLCIGLEEWNDSPYENKLLINNTQLLKQWITFFNNQLSLGKCKFVNPGAYQARDIIKSWVYQFDRAVKREK